MDVIPYPDRACPLYLIHTPGNLNASPPAFMTCSFQTHTRSEHKGDREAFLKGGQTG